jgi:hypothetical protein
MLQLISSHNNSEISAHKKTNQTQLGSEEISHFEKRINDLKQNLEEANKEKYKLIDEVIIKF